MTIIIATHSFMGFIFVVEKSKQDKIKNQHSLETQESVF